MTVGQIAEDDDPPIDLGKGRYEAAGEDEGTLEIRRAIALGESVDRVARRAEVGGGRKRYAGGRAGENDGDRVPSLAEDRSSRAPSRARSKREVPGRNGARMLIESSTTMAIATDAPPDRAAATAASS